MASDRENIPATHSGLPLQHPSGRRQRNTPFLVEESSGNYERAVKAGLMQVTIKGRNGKQVLLAGGQTAIEFVNCSYLGLDLHPEVIEASRTVDEQWGMNFCCARSRFSIEPQRLLEEELSTLYRGRAIVFPTTAAAHLSVMPLLASGLLFEEGEARNACLIFDRFAHSSMQFLKPVLSEEATVVTVGHNDLDELRLEVLRAREREETAVYVADGIYSMGGHCPMDQVLALAEELDFYVYVDDAHGLTLFGERGEGFALAHVNGDLPERMMVPFSLSKGFGAYGGGIVVAGRWRERMIRSYGESYAFSAAQTFQAVEACRAVVRLHYDGSVGEHQQSLRSRVSLFDELTGVQQPFGPIRMIPIGDEAAALKAGELLLKEGYFLPVAFFPGVGRGAAQLRVLIAANHSQEDIEGLVATLAWVAPQFCAAANVG
jgi:8-amino-7-oxononanoate synthase